MRNVLLISAGLMLASTALAQETVVYQYDALGRLVSSDVRPAGTGGRRSDYSFDKAGNRQRMENVSIARISQIPVNSSLHHGEGMRSANGDHVVYLQQDGNLVIYGRDAKATWATMTGDRGQNRLDMQGDGNLVLYSSQGPAVWSSGTWGNPGAYAELTNAGKLTVRRADGTQLWSS